MNYSSMSIGQLLIARDNLDRAFDNNTLKLKYFEELYKINYALRNLGFF
jgi:hypothetical protein